MRRLDHKWPASAGRRGPRVRPPRQRHSCHMATGAAVRLGRSDSDPAPSRVPLPYVLPRLHHHLRGGGGGGRRECYGSWSTEASNDGAVSGSGSDDGRGHRRGRCVGGLPEELLGYSTLGTPPGCIPAPVHPLLAPAHPTPGVAEGMVQATPWPALHMHSYQKMHAEGGSPRAGAGMLSLHAAPAAGWLGRKCRAAPAATDLLGALQMAITGPVSSGRRCRAAPCPPPPQRSPRMSQHLLRPAQPPDSALSASPEPRFQSLRLASPSRSLRLARPKPRRRLQRSLRLARPKPRRRLQRAAQRGRAGRRL